jgi:phosphoenolpyruvate carboxykinase (ATP)
MPGAFSTTSKLTTEQTMFHFISGYTSKMAGTEDGVTEPQATFSSCFAQPFLALHPMRYAKMLADKIAHHQVNAWLLNTGWVVLAPPPVASVARMCQSLQPTVCLLNLP